MVFPDAAVKGDENQKPGNIEDNKRIGTFSGLSESSHKIRGGNKIALPTVPAAQIS